MLTLMHICYQFVFVAFYPFGSNHHTHPQNATKNQKNSKNHDFATNSHVLLGIIPAMYMHIITRIGSAVSEIIAFFLPLFEGNADYLEKASDENSGETTSRGDSRCTFCNAVPGGTYICSMARIGGWQRSLAAACGHTPTRFLRKRQISAQPYRRAGAGRNSLCTHTPMP